MNLKEIKKRLEKRRVFNNAIWGKCVLGGFDEADLRLHEAEALVALAEEAKEIVKFYKDVSHWEMGKQKARAFLAKWFGEERSTPQTKKHIKA